MKLSNKVLIVFFGVLLLYLVSAFGEIRFRGTPNTLDTSNAVIETIPLSSFSSVIVSNLDYSVSLSPSDTTRIDVASISGAMIEGLQYLVRGDTLFLQGFMNEQNERVSIRVYFSAETFNSLKCDDASVRIEGLVSPELNISQNLGNINMGESNSIKRLSVSVKGDARLTYSGERLDVLSADLNDAFIVIYQGADLIEGKMENDSYLQVFEAKELDFKKDETSQLFIN